MDYFYQSAYIQGFTPGLQNAFLGMNYKPLKGLTLNATYHYMAVATSLEKLDMTLGHVIDLEASYNITKDLSLSAGFSFMKGTETMNELKQGNGDSNVRWGWLSFVVSPLSLYSSK
jgi:long-subunit fatty acid transport protein